MKVLGINPNNTTSQNSLAYKGRLSDVTAKMIADMQNSYSEVAETVNPKRKQVIKGQVLKLCDIFDNLTVLMKRFGHDCELTFAKSKEGETHRFYIENKHSFYKCIVGDAFLPQNSIEKEVQELENISRSLERINPFEENTNFIIQRTRTLGERAPFKPDADYVLTRDVLRRTECKYIP